MEPCSCVCYSPGFVLYGSDVIHKLNIHTGSSRPFLSPSGRPDADYSSLPIDVLQVSDLDSGRGPEFLCCFTGNIHRLYSLSPPPPHTHNTVPSV